MDINTIVLIVILAVIVYAIVSHNQEKSSVAEKSRQEIMAEKEEISKEEIATYGQVQERKGQLLSLINDNLSEHPEESAQLAEIIEDWADLKIEAFQNRRSWVRATPTESAEK
tara:strand:- start:169 stop:507 length:339 start_codon:yes stop_codon:yes gene_type:complete